VANASKFFSVTIIIESERVMTKKPNSKMSDAQLRKLGIVPLPAGVDWSDLEYDYKRRDRYVMDHLGCRESFEIWNTERFGWCIPVLLIRNASRRARARGVECDRYYAISLDGQLCTIGHGPHVKARHTVYVLKSKLAKLQKYLDLRAKGSEQANTARDIRSTRVTARTRGGLINRWNSTF
jgi:hypothetical protein